MKAGTFEFFSLYPTAAENDRAGAGTGKENSKKINKSSDDLENDRLRLSSAKKHKRRSTLPATDTGDNWKVTSTPLVSKIKKPKTSTPVGIESILKSSKAVLQQSTSAEMNDSSVAVDKPKKRNKSVSFVLDDGEVEVKKSKKSSDTPSGSKEEAKGETAEPSGAVHKVWKMKNKKKKKRRDTETAQTPDAAAVSSEAPAKKNYKKQKTAENIAKNLENLTIGDNANTLAGLLDGMEVADKRKKNKNKKKIKKNKTAVDAGSSADANKEGPTVGADEETSPTANGEKKKFNKNFESNGTDENTQDNEQIHRKNKKKRKRRVSSNETAAEDDGAELEKERVKWSKRKWNKDRKGELSAEELLTTVIVENLPLSLILSYKKLLSDHFSKYGVIKKIGIVEVYPTEEPRPVFTTTLQFYSDGAATQALEEDNMRLEGGLIGVKRPLPPTETTVAVRCYRGCSQEQMSSIFGPCGKIRSIREIQKGRSSMPTAFVEFDGPDAVGRALKVAEEAKIGGKKVTVQRFEDRPKGSKRTRKGSESKDAEGKESEKESDQEVDSS